MSDHAIAQLDVAQHALAECKTVMEAKQIADAAEAARVYLERTHASAETVNRATEIRLLAERQMGEFLKTMPKATGTRGNIQEVVSGGSRKAPPAVEPATLAEIGITKKESSRAQKLADIPKEEFHERVAVAKAGGAKLTAAKVIEPTPAAKRAGDEAESDSETLWRLKSLWKKTTKKDRAEFLAWIRHGQ
jgi:hypothetical protein